MAKRIVSVILILSLLLAGICAAAGSGFAAGDYDGDFDFGDVDGGDPDFDVDGGSDIDADGDSDSVLGFIFSLIAQIFFHLFVELLFEDPAAALVLLAIFAIVAVGIWVLYRAVKRVLRRLRGEKQPAADRRRNKSSGNVRTSYEKPIPINSYTGVDPGFSEERFKKDVASLYLALQNAMDKGDLSPVRSGFSKEQYRQLCSVLEKNRAEGRELHISAPAVRSVTLNGYLQNDASDMIFAKIKATMICYETPAGSDIVCSGSKTAPCKVEETWMLVRPRGGVTVVRKNRDGACPRCGGKLPEGGAVCPYCGSATENSAFNWKVKRANKVK